MPIMGSPERMLLNTLVGRRALLRGAGLGGLALLGACQAPSPTGSTVVPSAPANGGAGAWEKQWAELIEAAKQEGTVVFSGPPTPAVRTNVTARFKERFGVDVEYLGGRRG